MFNPRYDITHRIRDFERFVESNQDLIDILLFYGATVFGVYVIYKSAYNNGVADGYGRGLDSAFSLVSKIKG